MFSAKRRKVDSDVPSGLLKKKHAVNEIPQASASSSPEPAAGAPKEQAVKEPVKSFKDLVSVI
jgi:ATP-dependent RNA helicase DDX47/RRP3